MQPRYPNPAYKQYDFGNNPSYDPTVGFDPNINAPKGNPYDLNLIEGTVAAPAVPNSVSAVAGHAAGPRQQPPRRHRRQPAAARRPLAGIKHVIYIIKENRTYDQVLGDLPQGNGDPSLTLFGKSVTPNLHALASRFVLLDNFYDCAEATGDGWPWCTQSIATEYVIKNLPYNYSDRGRHYDFEGANNNYPVGGVPATDPYGNPTVGVVLALRRRRARRSRTSARRRTITSGTWPRPTASPSATTASCTPSATAPTPTRRTADLHLRAGPGAGQPPRPRRPEARRLHRPRRGAAWTSATRAPATSTSASSTPPTPTATRPPRLGSPYPKTVFGHYDEPSRFSEWNREFQLMLAQGQADNAANAASPVDKYVPQFMTVRLMHDHTQGVSAGHHTPAAEVADNDYGVGQLVQAVSQSPIWKHTAIFVIEDDAQDGPDHVDVHRSTAMSSAPGSSRTPWTTRSTTPTACCTRWNCSWACRR